MNYRASKKDIEGVLNNAALVTVVNILSKQEGIIPARFIWEKNQIGLRRD